MPVVLYEKKDRIAYITINRPEVLNAINQETLRALTEAWIKVRDDRQHLRIVNPHSPAGWQLLVVT